MPSINISEADFTYVANAANDALDRGDVAAANSLDKIARKINAALSKDGEGSRIARMASGHSIPLRWQDVPSVLLSRI